jgi:hypothetical protein
LTQIRAGEKIRSAILDPKSLMRHEFLVNTYETESVKLIHILELGVL